jgi:small subunit ribosomal protein S7e
MSADPSSKITKQGAPTDFELRVASALLDIENANQDLKNVLKFFFIESASDFEDSGNRALVITVNFRSMKHVREIQDRVVKDLEKKFKKPVVLIYKRTILPKYLKMKGQQQRPRSRTLTAVHDAILEDLIYPVNIVGRRTRVKTDGKRQFRVLLDPKDRESIEDKLDTITAIYKKICNKNV